MMKYMIRNLMKNKISIQMLISSSIVESLLLVILFTH